MTAAQELEAIATRIFSGRSKLTVFPSGAAMLDFSVAGEDYCVEYLPKFEVFGLSKVAGSSPCWEGVDEAFPTASALEGRIHQLLGVS